MLDSATVPAGHLREAIGMVVSVCVPEPSAAALAENEQCDWCASWPLTLRALEKYAMYTVKSDVTRCRGGDS